MSEDIVYRLHKCAEWHKGTNADCGEWLEGAAEIERLRKENAELREALKVAANFLDDAYTDIGRDEYKVAGFVARAAIREGGKDDAP